MDGVFSGGIQAAAQHRKAQHMASPELRLPENAPGAFYVTSDCTDCDLCRELAPAVFRRNDELGFSVVHHQPENEADHALAIEAVQSCPTEAIGCSDLKD